MARCPSCSHDPSERRCGFWDFHRFKLAHPNLSKAELFEGLKEAYPDGPKLEGPMVVGSLLAFTSGFVSYWFLQTILKL